MTSDIIVRDMASQLAFAAIDAEIMGPPDPPDHVTLPGARAAIPHGHLLAYQDAGHDQHTIVARINERHDQANADRLADHKQWVSGPYHGAIEEMRRREAEAAAAKLRERAVFEQLIAERDAENEA